eukprot:TRINITY_DN1009_c0_g1_i5.p3 TRINITY_DN1009_c0_g1~~TRINITY_DN1009_c0_g1_i5.p3  ORF type:complete len:110 (-),score=21.55 TRINITY_DN1009_c0_g1_i5:601-930(-)
MTAEELEQTEAFIDKLTDDSAHFNQFLLDIASRLANKNLTCEVFEDALSEVYRSDNAVPPESDVVQYIFDDLILKKAATVTNSDLSYRLHQLLAEHKREINARYLHSHS